MDKLVELIYAHMKAIVAGLGSMVILYFTLRSDGMTAGDWETLIIAGLGLGGFTFAVPNVLPTVTTDSESGYTSITTSHKGVTATITPAPITTVTPAENVSAIPVPSDKVL